MATNAHVYHRAADIPQRVRDALSANQATANVILPFVEKALSLPPGGDDGQLWIALFDHADNVAFVLSCTSGPLGNYPIFIVTCNLPAPLAEREEGGEALAQSMSALVDRLLEVVPPQRVFSVFSTVRVSETFARVFETEAHMRGVPNIRVLNVPYYNAILTFCTRDTFNEAGAYPIQEGENVTIALCRAGQSHVEGVAALCKAFSETSQHYVLDAAEARREAETMITNEQAWIHLVQRDDDPAPEIACLVATTRESRDVTAVTKVITAAHWRGQRCASRLLHRVCQEVLQTKTRVVLYVDTSDALASARRVYRKIGFQGLEPDLQAPVAGAERWVEIGFEGTELGHW